jgi:hypothetical protein
MAGPWDKYKPTQELDLPPVAPQPSGGRPLLSADAWKRDLGRTAKAVDDTGRAFASGVTFGHADEIAAGLNSLIGGGDYSELHAKEIARDETIPFAQRLGGEMAGGIASTVAAAPAVGAAAAVPYAGRAVSALANAPKWLKASGLGALFGAGFGHGTAEEGERLEGAAIGAGLGAGTGAAIGAGAAALSGINKYFPIASFLKAKATPKQSAARMLGKAMQDDLTTAPRARARLTELGPKAMLADVGGENVTGLARGLTGTPGPAKQKIMQSLKSRVSGEAGRLHDNVTKHLGPGDYFAAEEQFLGKLRSNARPAYEAAYKANKSVTSPWLERFMKDPIAKDALEEAAEIARMDRLTGGVKWVAPVDKELTAAARAASEAGKMPSVGRPGVGTKGLSLESWDYIKQGYDQVLNRPAYTNKMTDALNKKGRAVDQVRRSLVRQLDKATGGDKSLYRKARTQYAGNAETLNAIRDGAKFATKAPELIKRELARLSPASQEAYRNGAARKILDMVDSVTDNASAANRLWNRQIGRDRVKALFPDRGGFADFSRRMTAEQRFADTSNAVAQGSRRAPMLGETQALQGSLGNVGAVMGSKMPGGNSLVWAGIGRKMASKLVGEPGKMNKELARMLTSRNKADQLEALEMMAPWAEPGGRLHLFLKGLTFAGTRTETEAMNRIKEALK